VRGEPPDRSSRSSSPRAENISPGCGPHRSYKWPEKQARLQNFPWQIDQIGYNSGAILNILAITTIQMIIKSHISNFFPFSKLADHGPEKSQTSDGQKTSSSCQLFERRLLQGPDILGICLEANHDAIGLPRDRREQNWDIYQFCHYMYNIMLLVIIAYLSSACGYVYLCVFPSSLCMFKRHVNSCLIDGHEPQESGFLTTRMVTSPRSTPKQLSESWGAQGDCQARQGRQGTTIRIATKGSIKINLMAWRNAKEHGTELKFFTNGNMGIG